MKRSASALAALALLAAGCDDDVRRNAPAATQHAPAEVEARAEQVYGTFRAMFDNLPDPKAGPLKCPDDKIEAWTAEGRQRKITFLAYQSLRHTLGEPWLGTNSLVGFMTHSNVRYAPRPEFDLNKDRNVKQLMRMWNFVEYIGVVVPIAERKAKANSAYTGDGGAFEGQLVIYRPGEDQPICHTPFSATGSGVARYTMRVGEHNTDHQNKAQHALKRALCEAINTELETQLGRISSVLSASRLSCSSA